MDFTKGIHTGKGSWSRRKIKFMEPSEIPVSNATYGPPIGYAESQVQSIKAYRGDVPGPSPMEGDLFVAVAWKPSAEDLQRLQEGGLIYLTMIGGLAPHFLTTNLEEACYQT
jgi:hypothetical protein